MKKKKKKKIVGREVKLYEIPEAWRPFVKGTAPPWNFWYASRPNEIFLDLDSNRATARALSVLRLAVRQKELPVSRVWLYSTPTPDHCHLIIELATWLPWQTRLAWSLWMGNDRLRAAYVLQRHVRMPWAEMGHDLLVTEKPYYRPPDAICHCKEKHKPKAITEKCLAMKFLLRDERSADYFTRTGKAPPRHKIRIPWGEVSLSQLKNWKETNVRTKRLLQRQGHVGAVPKVGRRQDTGRTKTGKYKTVGASLSTGNRPAVNNHIRASGRNRGKGKR
jgi:hypothetical protein